VFRFYPPKNIQPESASGWDPEIQATAKDDGADAKLSQLPTGDYARTNSLRGAAGLEFRCAQAGSQQARRMARFGVGDNI